MELCPITLVMTLIIVGSTHGVTISQLASDDHPADTRGAGAILKWEGEASIGQPNHKVLALVRVGGYTPPYIPPMYSLYHAARCGDMVTEDGESNCKDIQSLNYYIMEATLKYEALQCASSQLMEILGHTNGSTTNSGGRAKRALRLKCFSIFGFCVGGNKDEIDGEKMQAALDAVKSGQDQNSEAIIELSNVVSNLTGNIGETRQYLYSQIMNVANFTTKLDSRLTLETASLRNSMQWRNVMAGYFVSYISRTTTELKQIQTLSSAVLTQNLDSLIGISCTYIQDAIEVMGPDYRSIFPNRGVIMKTIKLSLDTGALSSGTLGLIAYLPTRENIITGNAYRVMRVPSQWVGSHSVLTTRVPSTIIVGNDGRVYKYNRDYCRLNWRYIYCDRSEASDITTLYNDCFNTTNDECQQESSIGNIDSSVIRVGNALWITCSPNQTCSVFSSGSHTALTKGTITRLTCSVRCDIYVDGRERYRYYLDTKELTSIYSSMGTSSVNIETPVIIPEKVSTNPPLVIDPTPASMGAGALDDIQGRLGKINKWMETNINTTYPSILSNSNGLGLSGSGTALIVGIIIVIVIIIIILAYIGTRMLKQHPAAKAYYGAGTPLVSM